MDQARTPPFGPEDEGPLTPAQFHILLALAESNLHGYGIMQAVEKRTRGAVELGPGTLYRSIKQLLGRGLIAEIQEGGPDLPLAGSVTRRRSYALTREGRIRTVEEAQRLRDLVRWADHALAPEGGGG
jgi:DNA-binding PadR family transcriptional regulator